MTPEEQVTTMRGQLSGLSVVAVEMTRGRSTFDKAQGGWKNWMRLTAVVQAPGWSHSSYRAVELGELSDQAEPHAVGSELARSYGVPWSVSTTVHGLWIEGRPPPKPLDWGVCWVSETWSVEGHNRWQQGEVSATACTGQQAAARVAQEVAEQRCVEHRGPASVQAWIAQLGRGHTKRASSGATWPEQAEDQEYYRGRARGGERPSSLLVDAPGPLAAMQIMAGAFALSMKSVDFVGAWARDELDDAALDGKLSPLIYGRELTWNLAWLMRTAVARGEAPAAALAALQQQGAETLPLIVACREALSLSLRDAVELVHGSEAPPDPPG
jgi:hypothetical protein